MMDSDHLHTICETASPPIHYLNEMSQLVKEMVNHINQEKGVICVGIKLIVLIVLIVLILVFTNYTITIRLLIPLMQVLILSYFMKRRMLNG